MVNVRTLLFVFWPEIASAKVNLSFVLPKVWSFTTHAAINILQHKVETFFTVLGEQICDG
jgi:hypothetical protein